MAEDLVISPCLQPVPKSDTLYLVEEDWRCPLESREVRSMMRGLVKPRTLLIKRGFLTDGGSIPQFAWSIVGHPLQGKSVVGFVGHDGLYASELLTRAEADAILLELLARQGVSWLKRQIFWACVKAFGWKVWKTHTPESIENARKLVSIIEE